MALFTAIIISFIPAFFYASILYWLDRYEKEPRVLLFGVFIWGAVFATIIAYVVNTGFGIGIFALTNSENLTNILSASLVAPVVEESLKAIAVLIVFFLFYKEFDSVLDGIVYAGIAALGFAATENVFYLYSYGYQEGGWDELWILFFLRVIFGAWNHAFYTSFIGIGLATARLNRNILVKALAPLAGFGMALFTHGMHNLLASIVSGDGGLFMVLGIDWLGWLFMAGVIIWAILRERKWIQQQLLPEIGILITQAQYNTTLSPFNRRIASLGSLFSQQARNQRDFYNHCTELAYTKHQIARIGETKTKNNLSVEKLRKEIEALAMIIKG